ncbi:MAG: hypothetical protein K9N23_01300 [Akkermansiaceae bacterium]|nr:hypothetical protein [Akkermansiaceae bacterium]
MGKKSRLKKERRLLNASDGVSMWADADGIHSIVKDEKPSPERVEEMERAYRENIRTSPIWNAMVKKYGRERAEELLLECKIEID